MSDRGFTLAELAVALVLAAVVVVAAHGVLGSVADTWARVGAERREVVAVTRVRQTLQELLRSAVLFEPSSEESERSALAFLAEPDGRGPGGLRRATLWVDRDPSTPRQGLLLALGPLTPAAGAAAETLAVAPGAAGIEVRYFVGLGAQARWVAAWDHSTMPGLAAAPWAVELRVLGSRGAGVPALLALPIVVPVNQEIW